MEDQRKGGEHRSAHKKTRSSEDGYVCYEIGELIFTVSTAVPWCFTLLFVMKTADPTSLSLLDFMQRSSSITNGLS